MALQTILIIPPFYLPNPPNSCTIPEWYQPHNDDGWQGRLRAGKSSGWSSDGNPEGTVRDEAQTCLPVNYGGSGSTAFVFHTVSLPCTPLTYWPVVTAWLFGDLPFIILRFCYIFRELWRHLIYHDCISQFFGRISARMVFHFVVWSKKIWLWVMTILYLIDILLSILGHVGSAVLSGYTSL